MSELSVNSLDQFREMRHRVLFLDEDGLLYDHLGPETKKVFISGEAKGLLFLRLVDTLGKVEMLEAFCQPNTYLVEQL